MTAGRFDDEFLDGLRQVGDPPADEVVAACFADMEGAEPSRLVRRLVVSPAAPAAPSDPGADARVTAFLSSEPPFPQWADPALVAAGQERFARWGSHVFTALYAAALPSAYACWRGVPVLGRTARLVTDAKRRLNETAQFHLDVMAPGGMDPGGRGIKDLLHVRLMHAAVRWMILHDPVTPWDPALGAPINQEDLLETLLTFTEIVFEVFDRTGIVYTAEDADAYLHVWSLAGHMLGIRPDLLPLTRADTTTLMPHVRRRQFGPSDDGRMLTAALLDQGRRVAPPGLKGLPAATVRFYVGDATADLLGVPAAGWTRALFAPLASITRVLSAERAHRRLLTRFSDRAGFAMLQLAVRSERSSGRPPFAIPTELADRWGVTATGARKVGDRPGAPPAVRR